MKKNSRLVFGLNFAAARRAAGLSQSDVCKQFDPALAVPYLSRVENGHENMTLERAERLAEAVGASLHSLFNPLTTEVTR